MILSPLILYCYLKAVIHIISRNGPPVKFDYFFCKGKPDTGAALFARIKPVEHMS